MSDVRVANVATIRKGAFGRWYIFHPVLQHTLAWSGAQWVRVTAIGVAVGGVQVCTFETELDAIKYVQETWSEDG